MRDPFHKYVVVLTDRIMAATRGIGSQIRSPQAYCVKNNVQYEVETGI